MEETKHCPYCGEEILAVARKCKHCGEWLDGRERRMADVSQEARPVSLTSSSHEDRSSSSYSSSNSSTSYDIDTPGYNPPWQKIVGALITAIWTYTLADIADSINSVFAKLEGGLNLVSSLSGASSDTTNITDILGILFSFLVLYGYYMFFSSLSKFSKLQVNGRDSESIMKVRKAYILLLVAILCGHVPVVGWIIRAIVNIVAYVMILSGFSRLKKSYTFPSLARRGAGTLWACYIWIIVGAVLGIIPLIGGIISGIINLVTFFVILSAWGTIRKASPALTEEVKAAYGKEQRNEWKNVLAAGILLLVLFAGIGLLIDFILKPNFPNAGLYVAYKLVFKLLYISILIYLLIRKDLRLTKIAKIGLCTAVVASILTFIISPVIQLFYGEMFVAHLLLLRNLGKFIAVIGKIALIVSIWNTMVSRQVKITFAIYEIIAIVLAVFGGYVLSWLETIVDENVSSNIYMATELALSAIFGAIIYIHLRKWIMEPEEDEDTIKAKEEARKKKEEAMRQQCIAWWKKNQKFVYAAIAAIIVALFVAYLFSDGRQYKKGTAAFEAEKYDKAISWLKDVGKSSDNYSDAQWMMYKSYLATSNDSASAAEALKHAASGGDWGRQFQACEEYVRHLYHGTFEPYIPHDELAAADLLKMSGLGELRTFAGEVLFKNRKWEEAYELFESYANQKSTDDVSQKANGYVGLCYLYGIGGVEKDIKKAMAYLDASYGFQFIYYKMVSSLIVLSQLDYDYRIGQNIDEIGAIVEGMENWSYSGTMEVHEAAKVIGKVVAAYLNAKSEHSKNFFEWQSYHYNDGKGTYVGEYKGGVGGGGANGWGCFTNKSTSNNDVTYSCSIGKYTTVGNNCPQNGDGIYLDYVPAKNRVRLLYGVWENDKLKQGSVWSNESVAEDEFLDIRIRLPF